MENKKITLGLIQSAVTENIEDNFRRTVDQIEIAAKQGAQIICLQELFKTVYFPQDEKIDASRLAESIHGESTKKLSSLAEKLKIVLIAPIYEIDSKGNCYNTAVVIDADGKTIGTYRKNHIPFDPLFYEKNYFREGDSGYPVFHTKYAAISVLICYDQWFPEAARATVLQGAEIIFYPTAIGYIRNEPPSEGDWQKAWETVQISHAISNGVHVASVNRTGREREIEFWGGSFVCDSFGNILKKAGPTDDEIVIADVDLGKNKKIREDWGFLNNRRPDTYKIISQ